MVGYVFTFGIDGFGADTAPAHEEGVYLNYDKAFQHLVELNTERLKTPDCECFARILREDYHITDIKEICNFIIEDCKDGADPPFGLFSIEEIEIIE